MNILKETLLLVRLFPLMFDWLDAMRNRLAWGWLVMLIGRPFCWLFEVAADEIGGLGGILVDIVLNALMADPPLLPLLLKLGLLVPISIVLAIFEDIDEDGEVSDKPMLPPPGVPENCIEWLAI